MVGTRASITALGASLVRAVHTRLDRPALIDDPWGDRLVLERERDAMTRALLAGLDRAQRERIEALGSRQALLDAALRAHPMYGWVIVRTRFAEDALQAAVARGVRQYVILGAGLDSFALRLPAFARDVEVYEVDHPATQEPKRERLRACGVAVPRTLHFVPADLSREELGDALERSSFQRGQTTFFSWLGVTTYLTREANLATLRAVSGLSVAGSELVFTYVDQAELDPSRESSDVRRVRGIVASAGEPWVSGFDPSRLEGDLRAAGWSLLEDLGGKELRERYCRDRTDGLLSSPAFHVARALRGPEVG